MEERNGVVYECSNCGRIKTEYDDVVCSECGLEFVEVRNYDSFTYGDINCIDDILESKRYVFI